MESKDGLWDGRNGKAAPAMPSSTEDGGPMSCQEQKAEVAMSLKLTTSLSEMARSLFTAGDVGETLQRAVDLAISSIDGCDYAGIFLMVDGDVSPLAQTHPLVATIGGAHRSTGEGPCLDAIVEGGSFYLDDVTVDTTWPRFSAEAAANGIGSAMAVRVTAGSTPGALNLYGRSSGAFGVVDRANAQLLGSLTDLALTSAETHAVAARQRDNLQAGLATREMIGQALGILMERERITSDEAFQVLVRASKRTNRKLRDVAQSLVDTGSKPEPEAPAPSG